MQSRKAKRKPLNLIKQAFPGQEQEDQNDDCSHFEQSSRKPIKTVGGSLNMIAAAFLQENLVKDAEKTPDGSLSLLGQILGQGGQGEEHGQGRLFRSKAVQQEIQPLNVIELAFDQNKQEENNIQNIQLKGKTIKNSNRPLNILKDFF
jgi:hypothetical protein